MPHLPDLEAWAIFAKVAERQSFSQAARDLGLAKTTVSKAISRLEARLQTSLFHRTTRKLSLTETGRLSLTRAGRILADGTAIEADILEEAESPSGLVRLAAISSFALEALVPVLPQFMDSYPGIEMDLVLTENSIDVVAEGFDVAIQAGLEADSTLRATRLMSLRRRLVGAPALLARLGLPDSPEALPRYPALVPSHIPSGDVWQFIRDGGEPVTVRATPRYRANHVDALVAPLLAGVGIGVIPDYFVREALAEGRLVEMLPEWQVPPGELYMLTPPGRARPARVRVLLDFLKRYAFENAYS